MQRSKVLKMNKMPEKSPKRKAKKGLTPYQGDHRTFGYFSCQLCSIDWSSANSWADTAQKCELCKKFVFPHSQVPIRLRRRKSRKVKGKALAHRQDSCGKCIEIKGSCIQIKKCYELPAPPPLPPSLTSPSTAPKNNKNDGPKRKRSNRRACKA